MKSSNNIPLETRVPGVGGWRGGLAAVLLLALSPGGLAWAQETPAEETEDTSKRVDESEENYRQRMELREQRFDERPKITTTYAVQASEGKLDQLPPASRQHIKDQLRDMIIESRQWKPGEDITDYPYEPSAAAKTDPALHALEREAWVEQLQKHQEREAAAFANATGGEAGQPAAQEGDQGAGQQAQGQQPGQGQSGQGQSGQGSGEKTGQASSGAAGQNQSSARGDAESVARSERAAREISTAGVSESALSFLQGKGGQGGEATATNASTGDAAQGSSQDASQAAPEGGSQAGAQDAAQVAQAANAGSAATESNAAGAGQEAKEEKSAEEKSAEEKAAEEQAATAEVLAGTLAIDELQNMESAMLQGAGQQPSAAGDNSVAGVEAAPLQEPGTLSIDELKKLEEH